MYCVVRGEARLDWEIVAAVSEKLGRPFSYRSSSDIMDEIATVTPIYGGISHKRLLGDDFNGDKDKVDAFTGSCKTQEERG